MAKMTSPWWNTQLGVCEKHLLPSVPCPACLAAKDPDIEITPTQIECDWADCLQDCVAPGFEYALRP